MDNTTAFCKALLADESGVTAVEYGLLAALICTVVLASSSTMVAAMVAMYEYWIGAVTTALGV